MMVTLFHIIYSADVERCHSRFGRVICGNRRAPVQAITWCPLWRGSSDTANRARAFIGGSLTYYISIIPATVGERPACGEYDIPTQPITRISFRRWRWWWWWWCCCCCCYAQARHCPTTKRPRSMAPVAESKTDRRLWQRAAAAVVLTMVTSTLVGGGMSPHRSPPSSPPSVPLTSSLWLLTSCMHATAGCIAARIGYIALSRSLAGFRPLGAV